MRIFDCFTFFNELDLSEFRLKLPNSFTEQFVICSLKVDDIISLKFIRINTVSGQLVYNFNLR